MNTSAILTAVVVGLFILVSAVLVLYALRNKGDVRAELSHGSTSFRLEATDRRGGTRKRPPNLR
jgi:hypothetical protein